MKSENKKQKTKKKHSYRLYYNFFLDINYLRKIKKNNLFLLLISFSRPKIMKQKIKRK